MRLSVVIIAKNEAQNIKACLDAWRFAHERIVVDGGSSDGTAEVARGCGAKVVVFADWQGFGVQKNRALDLASGDWVMSVDADERPTAALVDEVQMALKSNAVCVYSVPRLTNFCGQWIYHCGWVPDRVERLFPRGKARFSDDLVHEKLVHSGLPVQALRANLLHYSYPSTAQYWHKLQSYSQAWARERYARGQRTSMVRAAASGLFAFVRSYILRLGFLDGAMGFAVCAMQAQAAFGKYFELYCLHNESGSSGE